MMNNRLLKLSVIIISGFLLGETIIKEQWEDIIKKIIDDAFSAFGILFFILIIWSFLSNSSYMFEKNSLLIGLVYLGLILLGNYMRYRKKNTR